MRYGRLFLAGDAAHTVPPTGAKGLNLALADVRVLAEVLTRALSSNDESGLDDYERRAIDRVWRAQHFSYWMTTMLHAVPGAPDFDRRRQLGELDIGGLGEPDRLSSPRATPAGHAAKAITPGLHSWLCSDLKF